MADTSLAKKLALRPGSTVLVIDPPEGHEVLLAGLSEGGRARTQRPDQREPLDFILVFVRDQAAVAARFPDAVAALKEGGVLWFAYPKKTAKVKTDLTRDSGWEPASVAGWRPVTQVAIDETWSALRFRPMADVKPRKG